MRARQEIYRLTETSLNRAEQFLRHGLELIGENDLLHAEKPVLIDTIWSLFRPMAEAGS